MILVDSIDSITRRTGHFVSWLLLLMVLIESLIVVLRYGFEFGSIAMQESVTYLHASAFLLGCAFALQADEHVRVDIFYSKFSPRQQALVNIIGGLLFLAPFCCFVIYSSVDYVEQAWQIKEASAEAEGIAAVYLLKTLIPLFAILLLLQTLAEIIRNALALAGLVTAKHSGAGAHHA